MSDLRAQPAGSGLRVRDVRKPVRIEVERERIDLLTGAIVAHSHMAYRGDFYGLGVFVIVDRQSEFWQWRYDDVGRGAFLKRLDELGGRLPYLRPALDQDYL